MATLCLYYVYLNFGLSHVIEHAENRYRPDSIYLYSETTQFEADQQTDHRIRKPATCCFIKVPLVATRLQFPGCDDNGYIKHCAACHELTALNKQSTQRTLREILAQNIRLARTSRGWSQETLAELSNLHRTYFGAVERSEISIGLDTLDRIAGAFDVPASTLIDPAIPTGLFYKNKSNPHP